MKIIVTALIVASFVGVAVFGFVAMNSTHGADGALCLANVAKSFGCLEESNSFSQSIWHAKVFKNFSIASLIVIGLAFLMALASLLGGRVGALPSTAPQFVKIENRFFRPRIQRRLAAWMQTLEKRDPAN